MGCSFRCIGGLAALLLPISLLTLSGDCRPAAGRRDAKRACPAASPAAAVAAAAAGAAVACAGTVVDLGLVEAVLAAAVSGAACPPR